MLGNQPCSPHSKSKEVDTQRVCLHGLSSLLKSLPESPSQLDFLLTRLGTFPFIPSLIKVLIEWLWNLIKWIFFALRWLNIFSVLNNIHIPGKNTTWLWYIIFYSVFLALICYCFVWNDFCIHVHEWDWPVVFLSHVVFARFWYYLMLGLQ